MNSETCTAETLSPPPSQATRRPPWLGLSVLLLAGFVTIFDLFVVNVAIPSMQTELGASLSQIGFIVAGYELAFGVLLVTGGRLGDLYGRRRLFIVGMAGFTIASLFCGIAPTVEVLIGARVAQGLAAALLFPQVYASIRVNFSGDDSQRAFGFLGMTLGLAAIAGQILGGFLVEADILGLGWRTIFLINVPIGLFAIAVARFIPETLAPERPALDWPGVALVSLGLTLLLVPLVEAPTHGWQIWSFLALAGAAILLVAFYRQQERRRKTGHQPLVDMALMRQPRFAQGGLLVMLIYSTASSFFLCFALLAQTGFGLSPFEAGSVFVPCSVAFVIFSLAAPRLVTRFGTPAIAVAALVYAIAYAALIGQVWIAGADLIVAGLIPALIVIGGAQAMIMTPLLNLVLGFVAERQAGMASGVISTLQQIGAALGVAAVGILFGLALAAEADGHAALYAWAFVSGMSYNVIAAVIAAILLLRLTVYERRMSP
ncbi:MFS transporter [Pseudochelatococcus contaminans]|uniref:EmrB/QacA subfamily drug resistance transporter n=1 Tax=Pseudochelatococcus contaminans TaxID=1538103 RepID=A0A7W5Z5P0_9HYPH|nr:MFS transporter [Pseudochelatococcus contaminans]MBB3810671.1 EmrB/QacA subfamily drug resistance transporter [Pseudochelatococcus contaminans]